MFTENSKTARSVIKKRLIDSRSVEERCFICGQGPIWNNLPLVLELDHINGVTTDNRKENLRLLCPHCHSQQITSNRKKPFQEKVSESQIIEAAKTSKNVREVLLKLNLADGNANYKRVRPILKRFSIKFAEKLPSVGRDFNWKSAPRPESRKVARPTKIELEKLIWEKPTMQLAKDFGVSDVAVAKWCKFYEIAKPARGYWAKKLFGHVV